MYIHGEEGSPIYYSVLCSVTMSMVKEVWIQGFKIIGKYHCIFWLFMIKDALIPFVLQKDKSAESFWLCIGSRTSYMNQPIQSYKMRVQKVNNRIIFLNERLFFFQIILNLTSIFSLYYNWKCSEKVLAQNRYQTRILL